MHTVANLERKCGRDAACIVTPVRGHLVDGFVKGKNFGGLLRADDVMSTPKVCWAGAEQLHKQEQGYEGGGCTGVALAGACTLQEFIVHSTVHGDTVL